MIDEWAWQPVSATVRPAAETLPILTRQNGPDVERTALRRFATVIGAVVGVLSHTSRTARSPLRRDRPEGLYGSGPTPTVPPRPSPPASPPTSDRPTSRLRSSTICQAGRRASSCRASHSFSTPSTLLAPTGNGPSTWCRRKHERSSWERASTPPTCGRRVQPASNGSWRPTSSMSLRTSATSTTGPTGPACVRNSHRYASVPKCRRVAGRRVVVTGYHIVAVAPRVHVVVAVQRPGLHVGADIYDVTIPKARRVS